MNAYSNFYVFTSQPLSITRPHREVQRHASRCASLLLQWETLGLEQSKLDRRTVQPVSWLRTPLPIRPCILPKTPDQNVLEAITWLHKVWDAVLVLLRTAQVWQKASYDSRREVRRFEVCKLVLMPDEWGQRSWLDTTKARSKSQRDFPTWTTRSAYKVVKDGPNISGKVIKCCNSDTFSWQLKLALRE